MTDTISHGYTMIEDILASIGSWCSTKAAALQAYWSGLTTIE